MKRIALVFVLAALIVSIQSAPLLAKDTETLKGSFVWNNEDQTGDLEAVFTKTAKNKWDVAFHFVWEEEPHVWAGTAEGNLKSGELKGEVVTDGERKNTFVFTGSFEDGTFSGTHGSMRDGEMRDTGTMELHK